MAVGCYVFERHMDVLERVGGGYPVASISTDLLMNYWLTNKPKKDPDVRQDDGLKALNR